MKKKKKDARIALKIAEENLRRSCEREDRSHGEADHWRELWSKASVGVLDLQEDIRKLRRQIATAQVALGGPERVFPQRYELPPLVSVSFVASNGLFLLRSRWTYADGIGDLKVGDNVEAQTRYGLKHGVVVELGAAKQNAYWRGPISQITRRWAGLNYRGGL